jgi:VIT1/CCC1 family predicted Fe2+/Mn2+ transporter
MKVLNKLSHLIMMTVFMAAFLSISSFAQVEEKSNDEMVKSMTDNLKQKILLTDDQSTRVRAILSEYVSNKNATDEDMKSAQQKVENLLDNKQKMKYNILKNEWWKNLKPVSKE